MLNAITTEWTTVNFEEPRKVVGANVLESRPGASLVVLAFRLWIQYSGYILPHT